MKKVLILLISSVFAINMLIFNGSPVIHAAEIVDPEYGSIYDWSDVLDDLSTHKNRQYKGPYYRIGIIGKHDVVEVGEDISLKFKLIHNHTGTYKDKEEIASLIQTQYNSQSIQNEVGLSVATTIGQTSVAKLGLGLGDTVNASIKQSFNIEANINKHVTFTETTIESNEMRYEFNLDVIPDDQTYFAYGTVAIYVKYFIERSYRDQHLFWRWRPEKNTIKKNYYAYKYLFDFDTFYYSNGTFGNSVSGVYSFASFGLN